MNYKKEILKTKTALINKALKSGIYENFGEKEIDKLKDKIKYNPYGNHEDRLLAKMLDDLYLWAQNLEDIKQ